MAISQPSSRIGVPDNLASGGTYDLLLVSVTDGYPVGQVAFALGDTPRKITGIQKVAQIFMKVLFTQKGSDVLNLNLGTDFPDLCISANRTSNDADFLSDVTITIKDAEAQTRNILSSLDGDLDSQLDRAVILSLEVQTESLMMYVQIVTMAGEAAAIAVPFPELDLQLANA